METNNLQYPEYKFVTQAQINDEKLLKFSKKKFFKALNIITGHIVFRVNTNSNLFKPEPYLCRLGRTDITLYNEVTKSMPWTKILVKPNTSIWFHIPCILPLPALKGFIRQMVETKEEQSTYLEYIYIEVSLEEAMAAYGIGHMINRLQELTQEENDRSKDFTT